MGLIQRMKGWLKSNSSSTDAESATRMPGNGTAVAGFVKRAPADVEIVESPSMLRSLAALMPPAVAAATPMRAIPLFLVSNAVEPADVTIVQTARPAPKLHLVHNAEPLGPTDASDGARFLLAARLASVASLNTPAGRRPATNAGRTDTKPRSKRHHSPANRPSAEKLAVKQPVAVPTKRATAKRVAKVQCFVRIRSVGTAAVVSVPKRAQRRAA
jgi:hypothetical protein